MPRRAAFIGDESHGSVRWRRPTGARPGAEPRGTRSNATCGSAARADLRNRAERAGLFGSAAVTVVLGNGECEDDGNVSKARSSHSRAAVQPSTSGLRSSAVPRQAVQSQSH